MKRFVRSTARHAAAGLLGGLAAGVLFFGNTTDAAPGDDVRTKRLILLNDKDEVRAVLATDKTGRPVLAFCDSKGNVRISIAITNDDCPAIGMTDAKDRSIIGLAVTEANDAAFTLMDEKGEVRAAVGIEKGAGKFLLEGKELGK
ncbi:MAG: hypothetical protein A2Z34_09770 [Planctomycetes bacterium RBG_16_59_8]|nr:MAG: hypothetical protein A2Z34_09770 [Planctomycetes bacterium RBG_16_59_8]